VRQRLAGSANTKLEAACDNKTNKYIQQNSNTSKNKILAFINQFHSTKFSSSEQI